jgi:hypothetical protein
MLFFRVILVLMMLLTIILRIFLRKGCGGCQKSEESSEELNKGY